MSVLGHVCHTLYSFGLKSFTHNHSTRAGPVRIRCHDGHVRQEVKWLRECPEALGIFLMDFAFANLITD